MTTTSTQAETYYDAKMDVAYDENSTGALEISASVGEFDGVVLGVDAHGYAMCELKTREDVDALIAHLVRARDIAFA